MLEMNRCIFLGYVSLLFLQNSCTSKAAKTEATMPVFKDQFFSPLHFHSKFFNNLSYPIWFQKSWIKEHKIECLTLRHYKGEQISDSTKKEFPMQKRMYYFTENGDLNRMHIFSYYDDKEITEQVVIYPYQQENSGFQWCLNYQKPNQKIILDTIFTGEFVLPAFELFKKIKSERRFCTMENMQTGKFTHLLYSKKYWGALSVDSLLKPKPSDLIVLGTSKRPIKIYNVESKVIETNVVKFEYWKNGRPKAMKRTEQEIKSNLHFLYSKNGHYRGYIDSSFLETTHLFNEYQSINYTENELPEMVKNYRLSNNQPKKIIDRFTFLYTHYE